ncbi:DNA polymerase I [Methylobrevis pamukkalensis]|uniref:DNA polymerase I n=1 Tax=Methylobrevis pamukkalensis TaxID=1439726 RepID=A0A1E3H7I1_9HYPH|nr:DNA polymerase I [Methylobrevis pamukkalensis]
MRRQPQPQPQPSPSLCRPARAERSAPAAATPAAPAGDGALTPQALAAARLAEATAIPFDVAAYETVRSLDRLDAWIAEAFAAGVVAVDTETTSLDAMRADLVGVSLATAPGMACYIPLGHRSGAGDLLGGGHAEGQIPMDAALSRLKVLFEAPDVLKVAHNLKYDHLILVRHGIDVAPYDDTMLLSYALDAGKGGQGMDELSGRWLGHTPIPYKDVAGSGRSLVTFDLVDIDRATAYAAEDADVTLRLWRVLKPRLAAERLTVVYETLERPLLPVLVRMERRGISVDRQILSRLSGDFAQSMGALEAEIHELAGEKFNLGSPKQLGEILFDRMGLPGGKKTKTGAWGTGATCWKTLPSRATTCRGASSTGASSPS